MELAAAWVARHPLVSSVVVGSHTMQQLDGYLAAGTIALSPHLLLGSGDAAPGVTRDLADTMWAHCTRTRDATQRPR